MSATKEQVSRFFAGVEGDQDATAYELIKTGKRGDLPDDLALFQIDENETVVKHAESDEHPYVWANNELLEPAGEYEGRMISHMFFFPRDPNADATASDIKKYEANRERFVGQVDGVLGKGACANLPGDTLEEMMEKLLEALQGVTFVGKVGTESAKNGYRAKNKISYFAMAETWGQETD